MDLIINHMKLDDIGFLQIRYTDVPGKFLARYLLKDNDGMENVFRDDWTRWIILSGFADINESDLILLPDKSTTQGYYNIKTLTIILHL